MFKKLLSFMSVIGLVMMVNVSGVDCINTDLTPFVENARQYEINFEKYIVEGLPWTYMKDLDNGVNEETGEMQYTEEEYDALLAQVQTDAPLGVSESMQFKYYYDLNGVYVYQQTEYDGVIYTMTWEGTDSKLMSMWGFK